MDNPKVTEERSAVPDWAKQESSPGTAQQQADEALSGKPPMSDPQLRFIKDLLEKKQIPPKDESNVDLIYKCCALREQGEYGMSKDYASKIITWLLTLKDKPREQQPGMSPDSALMKLSPGRYAIENKQGELRFYQLWESRDKKVHRLYVMFGPFEAKLPMKTQEVIAQKILDADPKLCALRFGAEIGWCSNCGLRLTNRISRELSIGPVCGDRVIGGDEWKQMKRAARSAIIERGEDPDEAIDVPEHIPHHTGGWDV